MAIPDMTLETAKSIAEDCRRIYRLLGNQASYPYHQEQIVRALMTLLHHHQERGVSRDELSRANRRYAALNARYTKLCKETGRKVETDDASEVAVVLGEARS